MSALDDLVWETSTGTGTGNLIVARVGGYQRISEPFGIGDNGADNPVLFIVNTQAVAAEWEIVPCYMSDANTLVRGTPVKSSNADAAVNFGSGVKNITNNIPASVQAADPSFRNVLINGGFGIDQRYLGVATAITDNAYWADRWRALGEASLTFGAKDTTIGGGRFNGKIRFTGTTDKGGAFQVVEGINCKHMRGAAVVLSAVLSVSDTRLGNIKMGIAEWTGTENATTADPVSAWGADGTTPTLAANWAFINTPANLSVTTTPTKYSVTATCGASMNNLAVIIWNDDKTYTANDELYFTDVQLELGSVATAFERAPFSLEQSRALRYFRSLGGNTSARYGPARTTSTTNGELIFPLVIPMRTAPSVTVNNVTNWNVNDASVNDAATALASTVVSPDTVTINLTCTAVTANRPAFFTPANANATFWINAEI